ncbi:hypothetical protein J7E91_31295 [Streptomyces sp. ISL-99]|uniref:hypothetical protein n=1 Tax=Streptomyces sp. ISL-99 TaxID=2819193 RepID=UPI001BE5DFB9|nr:hypothetical protein [Streptomyces sp. ISL-99]MBT2529751.1 hypothetical protein [Streptomyces sp. ISL-99]
MKRRYFAGVTLAALLALTGCDNGGPAPKARGDRETVEAYIAALNDRDTGALLKLDGTTGPDAERDAQKIVKEKGGRGLKVEDIRISYGFGPDVGSAKITAKDSKGGDYSENLTITRDDGKWYLTILPAPKQDPSGKTPAETSTPSDGAGPSKPVSG